MLRTWYPRLQYSAVVYFDDSADCFKDLPKQHSQRYDLGNHRIGEEEGECDADLTSFLVPRFRGPEVRFAPHLPSIGFENLQPLHDLRSRELLSVFEIEIGLSRAKIHS
jgi:hypothetical protein